MKKIICGAFLLIIGFIFFYAQIVPSTVLFPAKTCVDDRCTGMIIRFTPFEFMEALIRKM